MMLLDNTVLSKKDSVMRHFRYGFMLSALLLATSPAFARDDVLMLPIANAMATPQAQQKLGNSVKFFFGTHPATRITQSFGNFVANPKTNAFAKSEATACEWVFLSALISLQERAASVGANAVVNIESFYQKHEVSSQTEYECHKGFLMAGVALRGDLVRLADH
jgi:uncharacterized protein YbjQ (UPF0145 family)